MCLTGILFFSNSAQANNAGGFTAAVTTAVTTGTESFGANTDHFLDNGILQLIFVISVRSARPTAIK
jgi:hypothetical protein